MYDQGRYLTITGDHLQGTPTTIEDRQDAIDAIYAREFGDDPAPAGARSKGVAASNGSGQIDDDVLLEKMLRARNDIRRLWEGDHSAYQSQSEADLALISHLAAWCDRDPSRIDLLFRRSGLMRDKWDERRGGQTYGEMTIATALKTPRETYQPEMSRQSDIRARVASKIAEADPEFKRRVDAASRPGFNARPGPGAGPGGGPSDTAEGATAPQPPAAPSASTSSPTPTPPPEAGPIPIPTDAMIGLAGEYAALYGAVTEVPESFLFWAWLTVFGHCVSKKIRLSGLHEVRPLLYAVLLGESGETKKSTALLMASNFFNDLGGQTIFAKTREQWGGGSAEGVAQRLQEDPCLLMVFDELQIFIDKASQDGSVLLAMVNSLFESGRYDNFTRQQPIQVRGARVAIAAASTVETFSNLFGDKHADIGFINRLWLVRDHATKSVAFAKEPPAEDVNDLMNRTRNSLVRIEDEYGANASSATVYNFEPDALMMWEAWYPTKAKGDVGKRLDTIGARIMLLLAASMGYRVITRDVVRATLAWLEYEAIVRRECYPVVAESRFAALQQKILRALGRGSMFERDLERACNANRSGTCQWQRAIDGLLTAGKIQSEEAERGRRKTRRMWRLPDDDPEAI